MPNNSNEPVNLVAFAKELDRNGGACLQIRTFLPYWWLSASLLKTSDDSDATMLSLVLCKFPLE